MDNGNKKVIIIGAGPAGLTAAYELLKQTDFKPIIFEATDRIGGISATINYKGNLIDIGGHRFFSKSDKVMNWWLDILPMAKNEDNRQGPDPETTEKVMLVRNRMSRILYDNKFFRYPLSLNYDTLKKLGVKKLSKAVLSYLKIKLFPIKETATLEDFYISRFGRELYNTFFRDYTEKVWGVKCSAISAEWGAQRVKGVSITKMASQAIKKLFLKKNIDSQKQVETSLIEKFIYPKYGPGQLWETVAEKIREGGGQIFLNHKVVEVTIADNKVAAVAAKNLITGEIIRLKGDYVLSTMSIKDLVQACGDKIPPEVKRVGSGLPYRDFITVGLLLKKITTKENKEAGSLPDTWIYVQEKNVKMNRIQIFNNWSPYMVRSGHIWIGIEYCCWACDEFWNKSENELIAFATDELVKLGMISRDDVLDGVAIKMEKVYPAYFGTYGEIRTAKDFFNRLENLFLIGRNGMHRYNNMDHSMLTAMAAVENIKQGTKSKENIWDINTEKEYHEQK